ncbi:MAG: fluoride efflux transporter CrcB [Gammaproteobacteria bacterium]|nr:fluoride efflux transporter CrcB [Gammaproteobacteria bacterium]
MNVYFFVAIGGALGALTRFGINVNLDKLHPSNLPWGTVLVNIMGSFFIGVLFILFAEKISVSDELKSFLTVGFLGAMTTFSTFSLDALLLLDQGDYNAAFFYITGSIITCLIATFLGMNLARIMF